MQKNHTITTISEYASKQKGKRKRKSKGESDCEPKDH